MPKSERFKTKMLSTILFIARLKPEQVMGLEREGLVKC